MRRVVVCPPVVLTWAVIACVLLGSTQAWAQTHDGQLAQPRLEQSAAASPVSNSQVTTRADPATLYAGLMAARFDVSRSLEVQGLRIHRGPAVFHLLRGTWIPMTPVGGQVTGAAFVGEGRLSFTPPEGIEQDQLERFSESRTLDEPFELLYLRFSDDTAERLTDGIRRPAEPNIAQRVRRVHADVREDLLDKQWVNIETRLLVDMVEGREDVFMAWTDTREHGLLTSWQDPTAPDLYTLARWTNKFGGILDTWCAFGPGDHLAARPSHYVLDMKLDGTRLVEGSAEVQIEATRGGVRALQFELHPLVEVREVFGQNGEPLFFVRERESRKQWEDSVTVVFPEELPVGEASSATFIFGGDIVDSVNYDFAEYALKAPTSWYPMLGYLERATYDATFRVDPDHLVFASGELISDEIEGDERVFRFRQDLPVALMSFNYGNMDVEMVEMEGLPPITVFGRGRGLGRASIRNVGVDVGNSLGMFQEIFGEYPFPYMYVTRIPYSHGQGFPGLLHLAAGTFYGDIKGSSEAFRAHETSHQWWGHIVGWKTYRDQWISEGFAEYSGALYAAAYYNDPSLLDRMVEAWARDILDRGTAYGFERFGFSSGSMRYSEGSWAGPISLGRRLASSLSPIDYNLLVYEKGAYVLHMIRMLMYDFEGRSDAAFRSMMRDFVTTYRGRSATTEDFRRVVEKHMGGDLGWFFDQWVHGTAIPTYRYAWRTEQGSEGQTVVKLRVRQTVKPDVPFKMFVPVRFEFEGGTSTIIRLPVHEAEHEFSIELAAQLVLENVVLNHSNAVLAVVDDERW